VGDGGTLIRSPDQGSTWGTVPSGVSVRLYAVAAGDFAVGEAGTIVYSFDSGATWSVKPSGTTQDLLGLPLFSFQPTVVGEGGTILQTTDVGNTWPALDAGTSARLEAVQYAANNTEYIYCVGSAGTILKSTDAGVTWTRQYCPSANDLHAVIFYLNIHVGYAVGDGGTILKTTDGGETPSAISPPRAVVDFLRVSPNPSSAGVLISFGISRGTPLDIGVYSVTGQRVRELRHGFFPAGEHALRWGTTDWKGHPLPSGIYFLRVRAGEFVDTRKVTILR
jgi:photosystem II stability/assembly factor-like uncharacterized protein